MDRTFGRHACCIMLVGLEAAERTRALDYRSPLRYLLLPFDLRTFIQTYGPYGVAAIVFAETGLMVGFFLPGDSLLFTAGFLASQGFLDIWQLSLLAAATAVLGDTTGYLVGRRAGRTLFKREDSRFFKKKHLQKAHDFYERHGGKAIILAQFMPIVRTFSPVTAGIAAMNYVKFAMFNVIAAILWGFCIPWAGYFLGKQIPDVDRYLLPIVALIIVVSVAPSAIHVWRESGAEITAAVRSRLGRGRPPEPAQD